MVVVLWMAITMPHVRIVDCAHRQPALHQDHKHVYREHNMDFLASSAFAYSTLIDEI